MPAESVPLVANSLDSHDEDLAIEAAAALGECGRKDAVETLIAARQRVHDRELRRSFLISLGLSREPTAISHLLALIEKGSPESETALKALAPACVYPEIQQKAREAVERSGNEALITAFRKSYPG